MVCNFGFAGGVACGWGGIGQAIAVLSSWDVQYRGGVKLPQIGWWLDAHFPAKRSFVSHAHFDHLAAHQELVCSEGTALLMRARLGTGKRVERVLPFREAHALTRDTQITLYPAGHIFGSAMSLLEHQTHGSLLYTGDFKLRPGLSAEVCEVPRADVVIMETTYGKPHYHLPPTEKVLADIIHFCASAIEDGVTPVLFGYSLGKSQELLRSLTTAKLPVMLAPTTFKLTEVYAGLGIGFPAYRPFAENEVAGHVVICPPQSPQSAFLRKIPARRTATITGWAMDTGTFYRSQCDVAFPLSDHADYPDLLRFVELAQPKRVLTLHGFAAEFARDLRARGIEAWSLIGDNQLELTLPGIELPDPLPEVRPATESRASPSTDALTRLAEVGEAIKATPKRLTKIGLLRDYFRSLPIEATPLAAVYLTAGPFPHTQKQRMPLGWAALRRAVLTVAGRREAEFKQAYARFTDNSVTAEALLSASGHEGEVDLRLGELAKFFDELASDAAAPTRQQRLSGFVRRCTPAAAKYVIKIVTGDLRTDLPEELVLEALAEASGQTAEAVRAAHMLCGDLGRVTRAAFANNLATIQPTPGQPVQFMLASPEPSAATLLERMGNPLWLEEKHDGIRAQLHRHTGGVLIFSRDLQDITSQFRDLAQLATAALPENCILDGELLAWRDGRALPLAELQKSLSRPDDDFFRGDEIPVSFSCFDLLWHGANNLVNHPLHERRARLETLCREANLPERLMLAPVQRVTDRVAIDAAFLAARRRGNEGLIAKDPTSPYTPGQRGLAWFKLTKTRTTLDVVVVAVAYGHGKRQGVLSDYTFAVRDSANDQFRVVGKTHAGLAETEIANLTEHFLAQTIEITGGLRRVLPDTVLEIAFDAIRPSARHDSGFALRSPRIVRIRADKSAAAIDTLATCRQLASTDAFAADQLPLYPP